MTIAARGQRLAAERETLSETHQDQSGDLAVRQPVGHETDSAKELWAALLLQNITTQVVHWQRSDAASADGARGDGKMTFGAPSLDGDAIAGWAQVGNLTGDAESAEHTGQIRMELDGGRLGTVHLTVHRQGTVVSVAVGVADPLQRALVELELGSLTQALRAAGLNVGAVRVLHPDAAGTAFAQGKKGMAFQSTESASSAYRSFRARQLTDAEEGLDVVG